MSPSFTCIHTYTHTDEDDDDDKPKEKEKGFRKAEKVEKVETKKIPPPKWGKTKGKTDMKDRHCLMGTLVVY